MPERPESIVQPKTQLRNGNDVRREDKILKVEKSFSQGGEPSLYISSNESEGSDENEGSDDNEG
jgi:hypothetical protein